MLVSLILIALAFYLGLLFAPTYPGLRKAIADRAVALWKKLLTLYK